MNWGYRIALLYTGFALLIFTMIVMTYQQRVDLVASDYYEQELKYQDRIDAINRTGKLKETVSWQVSETEIKITFPSEMAGKKITGEVLFFCPSNAENDRTEIIPDTKSATVNIPIHQLKKGAYKIQISWKEGMMDYYNEGFIQIN
jgi:hypothetical protein